MGAGKFGYPGWHENPEWKGWWGPNPPFHTPVFVLTHHARPSLEMEGGTTFHFIEASPAEALETARRAADGGDVRIGGGPSVIRDFAAAGLIVWIACLVGWSTFILPFLFVLTPSLLMDGPAVGIALNFARVLFGIYLGTAAVVGYALAPLALQNRAVYGLLSLAVVLPPEAFTGAIWVDVVGVALAIAMLAYDYARRQAAMARPECG